MSIATQRALNLLGIDPEAPMYFGHTSSEVEVDTSVYVTVIWTIDGDTERVAVVDVPRADITPILIVLAVR